MSAHDEAGPAGLLPGCSFCGQRHASVAIVAECDVGEPICDRCRQGCRNDRDPEPPLSRSHVTVYRAGDAAWPEAAETWPVDVVRAVSSLRMLRRHSNPPARLPAMIAADVRNALRCWQSMGDTVDRAAVTAILRGAVAGDPWRWDPHRCSSGCRGTHSRACDVRFYSGGG